MKYVLKGSEKKAVLKKLKKWIEEEVRILDPNNSDEAIWYYVYDRMMGQIKRLEKKK